MATGYRSHKGLSSLSGQQVMISSITYVGQITDLITILVLFLFSYRAYRLINVYYYTNKFINK